MNKILATMIAVPWLQGNGLEKMGASRNLESFWSGQTNCTNDVERRVTSYYPYCYVRFPNPTQYVGNQI
jgi:hypothetical protein